MNYQIYSTDLTELDKQLHNELEIINKELSLMPDGHLYKSVSKNGLIKYSNGMYKNKKLIRLGTSKNKELFNKLARKGFLEKKKEIISTNINAIKIAVETYTVPANDAVISLLSRQYSDINKDILLTPLQNGNTCRNNKNVQSPNSDFAEFEQSTYLEEQKTIITSKGLKVRSKSEALIVEQFYEYGIDFHYEQVLRTVDDKKFIPDFTIRRFDGQIFYWEHCGMTNDSAYMKHHYEKMLEYEKHGIVPWKNLIVSYDDESGHVNMRAISHQIIGTLLID